METTDAEEIIDVMDLVDDLLLSIYLRLLNYLTTLKSKTKLV